MGLDGRNVFGIIPEGKNRTISWPSLNHLHSPFAPWLQSRLTVANDLEVILAPCHDIATHAIDVFRAPERFVTILYTLAAHRTIQHRSAMLPRHPTIAVTSISTGGSLDRGLDLPKAGNCGATKAAVERSKYIQPGSCS